MRSCGGSTSAWSNWMRRRRWRRRTRSKCRRASRSILPTARRGRRHPRPRLRRRRRRRPRRRSAICRRRDAAAARAVCTSLYSTVESNLVAVERSGGSGSPGAAASSGGEVERASPPRSERASKAGLDSSAAGSAGLPKLKTRRGPTIEGGRRAARPASDSLGSCSGAAAAGSPDERSVGATSLTALPHEAPRRELSTPYDVETLTKSAEPADFKEKSAEWEPRFGHSPPRRATRPRPSLGVTAPSAFFRTKAWPRQHQRTVPQAARAVRRPRRHEHVRARGHRHDHPVVRRTHARGPSALAVRRASCRRAPA